MITFFICLAILIVGHFVYGKYVQKVFGISSAPTPAISKQDGVDYVPLSTGRVFLIQLLNIAGLGRFLEQFQELFGVLLLSFG